MSTPMDRLAELLLRILERCPEQPEREPPAPPIPRVAKRPRGRGKKKPAKRTGRRTD